MYTKTPSNVPGLAPDKPIETKPAENKPRENGPAENKFDPFRPEMPQIPGVRQGSARGNRGAGAPTPQQLMQVGGVVVAALLLGGIFWWIRSRPSGTAAPESDATTAEEAPAAPALPSGLATAHEGPTVAATVDELSKPWATKKFIFVKPITHENIDAMVVRLPSGELWALSLQGPFGHCELEFVSDVAAIASKYGFAASHPMVVSPCDGTVYDPLKVGALGGNTWVRGEIVHGSSLRPPISIDVKVRGRSIVADSIE